LKNASQLKEKEHKCGNLQVDTCFVVFGLFHPAMGAVAGVGLWIVFIQSVV
jgi:hypothetical protein